MRDDFFEDLERRISEGEDIDDIIEDIISNLDQEEFRDSVRRESREYFHGLQNDPNRIYNIEGHVEDLFDLGFQELGSSSEEFEEYIGSSIENAEIDVEEIENIITSWRFFLSFASALEEDPLPEYRKPISELFHQASEKDHQKLEEVLDKSIEWRKFLYGFKKSMSRTRDNDDPRSKILVDKVEMVEDIFESIYKPTMVFVASLISIRLGNSINVDHRNVRQRIEKSDLDQSKFWDDEARHMRNSSSHNTYQIINDGVIIIDRDWRGRYSEGQLDDKISKLVEVSKNTLYVLSQSYEEYAL